MVTGYEQKYYADIHKIANCLDAILMELVAIKDELKRREK